MPGARCGIAVTGEGTLCLENGSEALGKNPYKSVPVQMHHREVTDGREGNLNAGYMHMNGLIYIVL